MTFDHAAFIDKGPELRAYWDAAQQGRFLLPHCRACGRSHWYPRGVCPHCFSLDVEARESSGMGVVYSFVTAPPGSSAVAYVTLDEGPTLLTRIVDAGPDALAIGQRVRVVFRQEPGRLPTPLFTPA